MVWIVGAMLLTSPAGAEELPPGITRATAADGSRQLVVNGAALRDATPEPEVPAPPATQEERRQGYVLYRRDGPDRVFRHSAPQDGERVASLSTEVSLGERRHMNFAIYALQDLGDMRVSCAALTGPGGATLDGDMLQIRPVRLGLWRDYWHPWFAESPRLIDAPGTRTSVSESESQGYWVTVRVPEDAAPGEYAGQILIEPTHGRQATLSLSVRVLPFRLDPGRWWGVYYYSGFKLHTPRDFADMKAHGVNSMLICPPGYADPVLERHGDTVVASFPLADAAMAELKRQGYQRPVAYFPRLLSSRILRLFDRVDGDKILPETYYGQPAVRYKAEDFPEDLKPVLKDVYRQMVDHAREAQWPEILWYLVDEPLQELERDWAALEYPLFEEACPGERTFCTAYSDEDARATGVSLDVRAVDLWKVRPGMVERAAAEGTEMWGIRWLCQHGTYAFPRQYAGLALDKLGLQGFTEWTYYGAPKYSPYAQLANKEGCHYAYTDEEGRLLSTIKWEAVQEGIDDARYVATLQRLVEAAADSDDADTRRIATQAQHVLTDAIERVPAAPDTLSEAQLDELRAGLAAQIVRLIR